MFSYRFVSNLLTGASDDPLSLARLGLYVPMIISNHYWVRNLVLRIDLERTGESSLLPSALALFNTASFSD